MGDKKQKSFEIGEFKIIDKDGKERKLKMELPKLDKIPRDKYANHIVINHNENEFNFFFARINPPISASQIPIGDIIEIPIVAKIVMTPLIAKAFLEAFNKNWEQFEKTYKKKDK